MLRVRQIAFSYPGQGHFPGLRGISFDLDRGEVLAVLGRSGSGKTTLLKCIYGLVDLAGGSVTLDGETVAGPSENLIAGHPGMRLVSQDYYVLDNHTVRENINDLLVGWRDSEKARRAERLMKLLELVPMADTKARLLSSGQKQRVAIARSLAVMPDLLLLDEPFNNLDKPLAEKLTRFIVAEVRKKKSALILITHDAEDALQHADRVMVLENGKVAQAGPVMEVYDRPRNGKLAALFGAVNVLRSQDLASTSRLNAERARIFVRPDRLSVSQAIQDADLSLTVQSSSYNGKCFEIRGVTATGTPITVYSDSPMSSGEKAWFRVNDRG